MQNKEKVFAIGDIHGQITMMKEMLTHWNEEEEQLVFIGDLGDRGEDPKACFELAKDLVDNHGAVCLRGNHEEMLLSFLKRPLAAAVDYEMNGGGVTIESFLSLEEDSARYDEVELAASIREKAPWLIDFLESLPLYYEWEDYVFVHAGVNLKQINWKMTSEHDFVWIREGFYDQLNHTGRRIVFGHTVTAMLYDDYTKTDIWQTSDGKIGIDGGAVYGGTLHGVVFSKKGIEKKFSLPNTGYSPNGVLRRD